MLQNEHFVAKFRFYTAEKELPEVELLADFADLDDLVFKKVRATTGLYQTFEDADCVHLLLEYPNQSRQEHI